MASPDVVDTAREAAALELRSARGARAARGASSTQQGIGWGRARGRAHRRGALERHLPGPPRRRTRGAAPPAAPPAAAVRPRRAARGAPAAGSRGDSGAGARGARQLRRRLGARRALLRDGGGARHGHHHRHAGALDNPAERRAHLRRAGRPLGRDPRRGLACLRARGLRQAHRLPRAPAAPLQRPVGAQQDARAAGGGGGRRLAGGRTCPSRPRPRSCTATTGSAT